MTTRIYPSPSRDTEVLNAIREISRIRQDDITEFENLNNIFVGGRKVAKIPTSSADVVATDQEGDINYDASYLYIAVLSGGNLVWRRVALASW